MSKSIRTAFVVVLVIALMAIAYAYGRKSADLDASARLFDVSTHLVLSCSNEHVVALTELREGKVEDAVRGLELLVTAKLEQIDVTKIPSTVVAKKSLESLRGPLIAYQAKFPMTTLDSKKNPRLESVMRALQ